MRSHSWQLLSSFSYWNLIQQICVYNANSITKNTAQKMKFSFKDFFSKCDQIRRKLLIWSHLLKKSLMEKFVFVQ